MRWWVDEGLELWGRDLFEDAKNEAPRRLREMNRKLRSGELVSKDIQSEYLPSTSISATDTPTCVMSI
jgi:hypothetical protein